MPSRPARSRCDPAEHPKRDSRADAVATIQSTIDNVVRRLIGNKDFEVEDLVQSSLVRVLTSLDRGTFRGDCPPGGWAAVIARNVAVDAIRARVRERQLFQADFDPTQVTDGGFGSMDLGPERLTDIHRTLDRLGSALAAVGPKQANAVYLHDVLGYELEEVATLMGTSVAAAQSRLVRGRRDVVDTMTRQSRADPQTRTERAAGLGRGGRRRRGPRA